MQTFPRLLYSLYRMTLMDEYQFDAMVTVDATMAHLLCGSFLFLSSILCLNLLIALLSDTFQRSVCLPVCLSVCLAVCLSDTFQRSVFCLSVCLTPSRGLSVSLSVCLTPSKGLSV